MNFCPGCNFLLYKNLKSSSESDASAASKTTETETEVKETYESILSPDMSECSLVEYCKNCGYENKVLENNVSVYKRNYQNDFSVDRILKNKYTVYDNTLPKLDIKCKNKYCINNKHPDLLSTDNAVIVNNIPENLSKEEIKNILEEFNFGTVSKISNPDEDYIKTINGCHMFVKRIKLCQLIIYFEHNMKKKKTRKSSKKTKSDDTKSTSSTNSKEENPKKLVLEILDNFKTYIEDYTLDIKFSHTDDTVSLKQFKTSHFKLPNNEVIFIKYDPVNMKYLYMCVNCGDSW